MCQRQVVALDAMSDDQRVAFLDGCAEEVCVSYRLPLGRIAAATALAFAAAAAPMAAAGQDPAELDMEVIVGGIKDPGKVAYISVDPAQDAADAAIPELPVVYEAAPAAPGPAVQTTAKPADPQPAKPAQVTTPAAS
ncbi:hypothetical protein CSW64_05540 [Caulobacter mirabilis]|uniref:Uncharacterized protein n=2 Tax=Caulobacter mirabilis TaxID=69666 RepID=A0A2D2AV54_9CAUL|nr:hypothetical protein CSW64_05540 [Caulobacter mirabilis]